MSNEPLRHEPLHENKKMKHRIQRTIAATCVGCGSAINFKEQPDLGDLTRCPNCKTYLEVVALSPLRLDWLFDRDESPTKLHAR